MFGGVHGLFLIGPQRGLIIAYSVVEAQHIGSKLTP
jgi:hypothetical protein